MNTETRRVRLPARIAALLLLGVVTLPARAGIALPKADHWVRLTPENSVIGNFPAQKAPILTVKSGATVRIDGGGGNRWGEEEPFAWLKANGVTVNAEEAEAIREIDAVVKKTERYADIKTGHLLVGPIAIEGAMPGDTIEVRVLKVTPRIPYGTVSQRPGRGGIPDDV